MISQYSKSLLMGTIIMLRKLKKEDYQSFMQIEDVMESRLLMNDETPFPPTEEDHNSFLNEISANKDDYTFAIETIDGNQFIGSIAVYLVNWKNASCNVGISIGPEYQGNGYGTDAMKTLVDFIFNYMNINKIKLHVFSFNKAAVRSYEKCGFIIEGTLRDEIFRFGAFHDVYAMGITRKDWIEKKANI
ncbi:GNAT family N-acetyltransferase [Radiobacillus sp. PE A8.2]|uniref:GNAT family N-acetyltransferase n=1 Tax=Radiobacillus sp. PE A8.2 TaxID=3380349 RepID=UPI00388E8614